MREEFVGRFPADAVLSAELIASELVTNAVKYGTPDIVITVHDEDGYMHVEVEDRGRSFDPGLSRFAEGGHGLPLVASLAEEWGLEDNDYGLLVWARLLPGPPSANTRP